MSTLRENTSSNIDVNNSNVTDKTGASKTVSFASTVSEIDFGRVSDIDIVKGSGLISPNLHNHGDQILADRGFTLEDEFAAGCGVELIIPSFTKGKK